MKHLLGIDVGFANLGICAFEFREERNPLLVKVDVIRTKPNKTKQNLRKTDDDLTRAHSTWLALEQFYYELPGPVACNFIAAVEMPHGGAQGARANRLMGMASTLVAGWLWSHAIPFEHYSPGEIKEFTTGREKGSKEAVLKGLHDKLLGDFKAGGEDIEEVLVDVINEYQENDGKGLIEHAVDAVATGWLAYKESDLVKAFLS